MHLRKCGLGVQKQVFPRAGIDFRKVGDTQAYEDMQHFGEVLGIVLNDHDDSATKRLADAVVVDENLIQALFVPNCTCDTRES